MSFLPLVWAGIIAFGVVMYVILDGTTLGTGMIMPFLKREDRDIAMSVILPTWDGNQTWLVLGGASLYGAFPLAFSALLPVLYMPLLVMVVALLLRGVAFEFRLKGKKFGKLSWGSIFSVASLVAVLCQGLILGNFVEGFEFQEVPYIISNRAFITPFVVMCSAGLMLGYLLLASTRLIAKTAGALQQQLFRLARIPAIGVIIAMGVVSLWTPLVNPLVHARWFTGDNWVYLLILPYLTSIALFFLMYGLWKKQEHVPFWSTVVAFLGGYIGFAVSLYPYIVPYKITIWEAASPHNTLIFLLIGTIIMLPILLIYTGYSYFIFRGKVKDVIHY